MTLVRTTGGEVRVAAVRTIHTSTPVAVALLDRFLGERLEDHAEGHHAATGHPWCPACVARDPLGLTAIGPA